MVRKAKMSKKELSCGSPAAPLLIAGGTRGKMRKKELRADYD